MATITSLVGTDIISTADSMATINTNFTNLNSDKIETSYLDTDTAMAANSDTKIPSQKAVKTYIDTTGGANASTTVRGIVEEATSAEMIAGTATGGTGARLFLNPSLVAETGNDTIIKTKSTGLLDTSIIPGYTTVPFFQQTLGTQTNDSLSSHEFTAGSMTDGSAFFVRIQGTSTLTRFGRDTVTGQYLITHVITPTLTTPNTDNGAIINIGDYIYLFTNNGTNIVCSRFLAADLTGETVMTVPTVACTAQVGAWTDGTNAYVVSDSSDTTSRKWSVSGTTFSASTTATVADLARVDSSTMWDGTSAYHALKGSQTLTINKFTNIDGSTKTATTKKTTILSDTEIGTFIINIDTTKMYIGFCYSIYDEAAQTAVGITLIPVTKP